MIIISSREFRQNQKIYFDLIDKNEQIIIRRGTDKAYKILPIDEDDRILSEKEFIAKINASIQQADDGKISVLSNQQQKDILGL
jgi:antitoxin YefM